MRILVVNPYGIGDVLFSLPLVQTLRESYPDAFMGFVSNRRTEELVACWPMLDWRFCFEKDEFRSLWGRSRREGVRHLASVVKEIRRQRFDLLIDLSLGWHVGLAGWLAGIPRRIGFNFRRRGKFLTQSLPTDGFQVQPVADYYLDLLSLLGIGRPPAPLLRLDLPADTDERVEGYLRSTGMAPRTPYVALVPGGGASWGPNASLKQWPPDRFRELAAAVASRHGLRPLLVGDAQEAALCQGIAAALSPPAALAVQVPSLVLLAGLLRRSALVIGNDSGPLHIAAAVGARSLTLFGPVDGSVYGPYPGSPRQRVAARGLACRPCYRNFRVPPCPWDNACLKGLKAAQLLSAVDEMLRT